VTLGFAVRPLVRENDMHEQNPTSGDPAAPSPQPNPPRVVIFGDRNAHEIRLHNPQGIADAIGPKVLGAFLKCFMGVERIVTFEHLIYLNEQARKQPGPEADEQSFDRNNLTLAMMLAGTMYEIGEALQQLCNAKVAVDPKLRQAWAPLDMLRKEWNTDKYAAMIRNGFVFHLGDIDKYTEGVAKLTMDPAILFETTGSMRVSGRYHAPWNALFKAHKIVDEEIEPFVKRTQKAHVELPEFLYAFFRAALDARGVPVTFEK
jgi:hypothetical protein